MKDIKRRLAALEASKLRQDTRIRNQNVELLRLSNGLNVLRAIVVHLENLTNR